MSEKSDEFRGRVEELIAQFEDQENIVDRWITRRYPKDLKDEARLLYTVPALYLQRGTINLMLDPLGYDLPGAEGAADLYRMPAFDPEATIYFYDGRWMIHRLEPPDNVATFAVTEGQAVELSVGTIGEVLDSIASHATASS